MGITSIIGKVLRKSLLDNKLRDTIVAGRGNIANPFPSDFTEDEKKLITTVQPFTMTSQERLVTLYRSVEYIHQKGIQGDIVECGVWKGGSMMLTASLLNQLNDTSRSLFLFDTYEGMSEPSENDVSAVDSLTAAKLLSESDRLGGDNVWCYSPIDEVKTNLAKSGYNMRNIHFVKGKVEDTIPHSEIKDIALLRLDTDWYESTKHELIHLYDRLVSGGVLIIDDYGHWSGSRKAVDEFFAERGLSIFLHRIDYTGRMAIKP